MRIACIFTRLGAPHWGFLIAILCGRFFIEKSSAKILHQRFLTGDSSPKIRHQRISSCSMCAHLSGHFYSNGLHAIRAGIADREAYRCGAPQLTGPASARWAHGPLRISLDVLCRCTLLSKLSFWLFINFPSTSFQTFLLALYKLFPLLFINFLSISSINGINRLICKSIRDRCTYAALISKQFKMLSNRSAQVDALLAGSLGNC